MGKLQRWETVYVKKKNGGYSAQDEHPVDLDVTETAAVGVSQPLAISATPHAPAVAAAPNPGEYTGRLPVGEYTERLPVGEYTQLLRPGREESIDALRLTTRSSNCLKRNDVNTIDDLTKRSEVDLWEMRNLGEKSVDEIKTALAGAGHTLRFAPPEAIQEARRAKYGWLPERDESVPGVEFKSAGLMGADLPDPPMFREVKEQLDPWADVPGDDAPSTVLDAYDEECAALLAGYDQDRLQLFAESAARWRVEYRQVTAS